MLPANGLKQGSAEDVDLSRRRCCPIRGEHLIRDVATTGNSRSVFLIQITKSTGHRSCALSYHLNGASRMSRARKRSFEGKYLGNKVHAELSDEIGSATEDPETADQGRRAVRSAGIPALEKGGCRCSGS